MGVSDVMSTVALRVKKSEGKSGDVGMTERTGDL